MINPLLRPSKDELYQRTHANILKTINQGGGRSGIDIYVRHKSAYDSQPDNGLAGKMEILDAVTKKHNFLGDDNLSRNTISQVEAGITIFYRSLELLAKKIPIADVRFAFQI